MEEILYLLLRLLVEILWQFVLEVLVEFGLLVAKHALKRPATRSALIAAVGLLLMGAGVGGASLLIWPDRLFPPGPIPGLSLFVGPLAVGVAMHAWGRYRRAKGRGTTSLATFFGGAAFALGTAVVRFLGCT